jgi:glycosyltransferase involved in cell wall biosynthesis
MERIKISACIITYNQQDYIRQCLEGAVNQVVDYDYEIVIGDDCSTDNTFQICQEYANKYPNKIRLLSRERNLGMAENWADTIKNCHGKYVAMCEGDDYWTDNSKLQNQVDFLESNPDYVLNFHKVSVLKATGEIVEDFLTEVPQEHETGLDIIEKGNYIHTPSVVFRNLIKEFPNEFYKSPIVDYFLYILLSKHGKAKYLSDEMAVYRHGVGIFTSQNSIKMTTDLIRLYSNLLSFLEDEKQKELIYYKMDLAVDRLLRFTKYQYTRDAFLSKEKSFLDLAKIGLRKIIRK